MKIKRLFFLAVFVLYVFVALSQVTVSTLAGTGDSGFKNGDNDSATFSSPFKIATDKIGNVFVADMYNYCVRKITSSGVVSTVSGTGMQGYLNGDISVAQFGTITGICLDTIGNIYVTDNDNHRVRKIDTFNNVSDLTGSAYGEGFEAFGFKNGNIDSVKMAFPSGITYDKKSHCLYVSEMFNACIRKIDLVNNLVSTYAAKPAIAGGSSGYMDGPSATAMFNEPEGLVVDDLGNLFVADAGNHCIRKISTTGIVTTLAGIDTAGFRNGTGTSARFNHPADIAISYSGKLYVADVNNSSIREITSSGQVSVLISPFGTSGYQDGSGAEALFSSPTGIAIDSKGNKYIADNYNQRIRKIMFRAEGDTICAGEDAVITPTGGNSYKLYAAASGGSAVQTGLSFQIPGIEKDTVVYVSNIEPEESERVAVTITAKPSPVVDLGSATIYTGFGNPVTLDPGFFAGATYLWYPNGENTQSITVSLPIKYAVTVTNENGCSASDTAMVAFANGFSVFNSSDAITVTPNPFKDHISVQFSEPGKNISAEIYDVLGNKMAVSEDMFSGGSSLVLYTGAMQNGIYFLVLRSEKNILTIYKLLHAE